MERMGDRLTRRDKKTGIVYVESLYGEISTSKGPLGDIFERLCAYEDLGFYPEEALRAAEWKIAAESLEKITREKKQIIERLNRTIEQQREEIYRLKGGVRDGESWGQNHG